MNNDGHVTVCDNSLLFGHRESPERERLGKLISATIAEDSKHYYGTILGERQNGSKWGEELTEPKLVSLPWQDGTDYMEEHMPAAFNPRCGYMYVDNAREYFPNMAVGAVSLSKVLEISEGKFWKDVDLLEKMSIDTGINLKVMKGPHGYFLCGSLFNRSVFDEALVDVDRVWLISGKGPKYGEEIIYTIHPGDPLAPLKVEGLAVKRDVLPS